MLCCQAPYVKSTLDSTSRQRDAQQKKFEIPKTKNKKNELKNMINDYSILV